jgi:hypothetical protein
MSRILGLPTTPQRQKFYYKINSFCKEFFTPRQTYSDPNLLTTKFDRFYELRVLYGPLTGS